MINCILIIGYGKRNLGVIIRLTLNSEIKSGLLLSLGKLLFLLSKSEQRYLCDTDINIYYLNYYIIYYYLDYYTLF